MCKVPREGEKKLGFHLCVLERKDRQGSDTRRRPFGSAARRTEVLSHYRREECGLKPRTLAATRRWRRQEDHSAVKALRL